VHANYVAELPLEKQREETLFWEHLSDRLPEPHFSGKHVFCGHTPQPDGNIGIYGHLTCLDTGCFAGYWLSAMDAVSGETWRVSKQGHLRKNWKIIKKIWRRCRKTIGRYRS